MAARLDGDGLPGKGWRMLRFALRRLVRGVLTIWVVGTLVFFGPRLQGDPVIMLVGSDASPEAYGAMTSKLEIDRTPPEQCLAYLGSRQRRSC